MHNLQMAPPPGVAGTMPPVAGIGVYAHLGDGTVEWLIDLDERWETEKVAERLESL